MKRAKSKPWTHPAGPAPEKRAVRHDDTRLQAERNRHALRRAQCIGRQSHRTVQWPASPSRIPEVPAPPGLGLSRRSEERRVGKGWWVRGGAAEWSVKVLG